MLKKDTSFQKKSLVDNFTDGSKTKVKTSSMNWKEWRKHKRREYLKMKKTKALDKTNVKNHLEEAAVQPAKKQKTNTSKNQVIDTKINKVKNYTVSIAVPGSILDNAQSPELKTYLAGQVARAAAVFNVNEVIVFSESVVEELQANFDEESDNLLLNKKNRGCMQLVRILQYLECPQYLRKFYFPLHKDLEYAGLLNPLDIPHHLRADEESQFREGIVLDKPAKEGKGSYVNIGLKQTAVIDKVIETNVRVTVKLDAEQNSKKHLKGKVVSPTTPFKESNTYWGYNVRFAKGLNAVMAESPYKGGYDLTVGTSDKGKSVDSVKLPQFRHLLIVFGGLKGLEPCFEEDESITASNPNELFNFYLNTCPSQGSRTIRTEEAILITLSSLRPLITHVQSGS